jgi:hypothetical protein
MADVNVGVHQDRPRLDCELEAGLTCGRCSAPTTTPPAPGGWCWGGRSAAPTTGSVWRHTTASATTWGALKEFAEAHSRLPERGRDQGE